MGTQGRPGTCDGDRAEAAGALDKAVGAAVDEAEHPVAPAVRVDQAPRDRRARHRPALGARADRDAHQHDVLHNA